jgi:hypothetical protein
MYWNIDGFCLHEAIDLCSLQGLSTFKYSYAVETWFF